MMRADLCAGVQVCRCAGVQVCGRAGGRVCTITLPSPFPPHPSPAAVALAQFIESNTVANGVACNTHLTTTNITPTPALRHACAATTPSRAGHAGADTAKYASQVLVAQFLQHMRQVETPSGGRFGDRKVSVRSAQMRARPIVVSTWRVFTPKTSP